MPSPSTDRFDRHLTLQAELSFDLERTFFTSRPEWRTARTVVDVGCGSGAYLRRLAMDHRDIAFIGVDVDVDLVEIATRPPIPPNLRYVVGEVDELVDSADVLMSRFCLMYTDGLAAVTRWARDRGVRLVIEIDNADEHLDLGPGLAALEQSLAVSRRRRVDGFDRTAENTTARAWRRAGFTSDGHMDLIVSSEHPNARTTMAKWFEAISMLTFDGDPDSATSAAIQRWGASSERAQYGMRASYFVSGSV